MLILGGVLVRVFTRYKTLSNENCMAMYITRYRRGFSNFAMVIYLCIFENRETCDKWFVNKKTSNNNIKSCGLEGLSQAIDWLKELKFNIRKNDLIIIYWDDEKRHRAFKYLKRYGFRESVYKNRPCYLFKK